MKASAFEFRFRFWIILAIYLLGFTAPWNLALHLDGHGANAHVWGLLATSLTRLTGNAIGIGAAFNLVLVVGILCGLAGALLRTWGTAYLGAGVMRDSSKHGDEVVAYGPYSHVRNPLYVGSWIFTLLLTLLMPASGAVFTLLALVGFQIRLILSEEAFLAAQPGRFYVWYFDNVPRLLPSLRPLVATGGRKAQWGQALAAEIFMWGVIASFAVLGWRYNTLLLDQCVLVWLGVAMIVRGFAKQPESPRAEETSQQP